MPGLTPAIIPVDDPIVAIEVLELLHRPEGAASLNVAVVPGQRLALPTIADGVALMVTKVVDLQPVART